MKKQAKQALIGSGVAAAMVAAAATARRRMADYFVDIALARKAPPHSARAEKRIASSANEDLWKKVQQEAEAFAGKPHETVEIQSRDNTRLVGHWLEVENPKRIVVAMHGWRSSWNHDFGLVADFFREKGCSLLCPEQRGQGSSGGEYMGFGLIERYDCLDWVNWVNDRTGGKHPIYLCGISMGASTVLMAAGQKLPPNVRGIIADCGFTSPVDIWKYVAKNHLRLPYGVCGGPAGRSAQKRLRMAVDEETCPKALARCRVPVLFVHGTDDSFVPVEMTYENYKACQSPKRLFIVPGAEHGMSYLVDPEGYRAAVEGFWEEFDKT